MAVFSFGKYVWYVFSNQIDDFVLPLSLYEFTVILILQIWWYTRWHRGQYTEPPGGGPRGSLPGRPAWDPRSLTPCPCAFSVCYPPAVLIVTLERECVCMCGCMNTNKTKCKCKLRYVVTFDETGNSIHSLESSFKSCVRLSYIVQC